MARSWILQPLVASLLISLAVPVAAQQPLPHRFEAYFVDSGEVWNRSNSRDVTYSETVRVAGATWLRLFFNQSQLGEIEGADQGTVLRITSIHDGAVQEHTAKTLAQWQYASAFFNGDEVKVELIADPEAPPSRLRITEIMVGEPATGPPESICGATDDRTLSSDPRAARIVPVGCTAWLIDDAEGCFLTAGHCTGASFSVIEFNVPLSSATGSVNHPPPSQQYAIDASSLQWNQTVIGDDWAYFGAFPNPETELTPFEAQAARFVLAPPPGAAAGQSIRVTGYGTTTGTQGTPLSWSQVQTTHAGPLTSVSGTVLQYATDTTGGDSGSPVIVEADGTAIGIHTNAGCSAGGGANSGTSLANAGVAGALANPVAICAGGPPPLRISLAGVLADPLPPAGTTFQVDIVDRAGAPAAINAATLVYDAGGGDQTAALTAAGGTTYDAAVPALACGTEVLLRVDVETPSGATVRHPFSPQNSVDRRYRRTVADSFDQAFRDTFESDLGWTVDDDASLTAGSWARGLGSGFGLRGDPPWDADSSGQAFLTDPAGGNTDVDGGATRLTSPRLDAAASADPHITYWRWYDDAGASDDTFIVELSNNDGATWTSLETIGPNVIGAWVFRSFRIADLMSPTSQMRLRFTASDLGAGNVIEAAVDGVALFNTATGVTCSLIFSDGFEASNTSAWSATVP